jgi:hypothetical protein
VQRTALPVLSLHEISHSKWPAEIETVLNLLKILLVGPSTRRSLYGAPSWAAGQIHIPSYLYGTPYGAKNVDILEKDICRRVHRKSRNQRKPLK